MKFAKSKNDVPKTEHFAIIEFGSVYQSGNGSGWRDGSSYIEIAKYFYTTIQAEWEVEIKKRTTEGRINFLPIIVKVPSVSIEIKID